MQGYISGRASIIGRVAWLFPGNVQFLGDGFETRCDDVRYAWRLRERKEAKQILPFRIWRRFRVTYQNWETGLNQSDHIFFSLMILRLLPDKGQNHIL
jgi:hypothetical protein